MTKRVITVGHSPDPDDAFMFYALAHDKLDTGDLQFRHELQDIETLNRRALNGELEVTAVKSRLQRARVTLRETLAAYAPRTERTV